MLFRAMNDQLPSKPQDLRRRSINDIIVDDPSRVAVLEKFGIDYLHNRNHSLEDECQHSGINLSKLLQEISDNEKLSKTFNKTDWYIKKLEKLIEHFKATYHDHYQAQFTQILNLIEQASRSCHYANPQLPKIRESLFEWVVAVQFHVTGYQQLLLPFCKSIEDPVQQLNISEATIRSILEPIKTANEKAEKEFLRLCRLTSDFTCKDDDHSDYKVLIDTLRVLGSHYHQHVQEEQELLFPCIEAAVLHAVPQGDSHSAAVYDASKDALLVCAEFWQEPDGFSNGTVTQLQGYVTLRTVVALLLGILIGCLVMALMPYLGKAPVVLRKVVAPHPGPAPEVLPQKIPGVAYPLIEREIQGWTRNRPRY